MTSFGVWVIERLNNLVPTPINLLELHSAKLSVEAYQAWEEEEVKNISPDFGPLWDIKDCNVLDIGCGLGGKLTYYAGNGARLVTAIDIRHQSTTLASHLAQRKGYSQILPVTADAAAMPFPSNRFDVIVSINVFEHIDNYSKSLEECKRVIRQDGTIFLHFSPFYSPWGAHLEGWINIPWPHIFFSDKDLIEAARRVEEKRQHNNEYIPTAQVNWAKVNRLPELNRVTVRQFMQLIKKTDLKILGFHMLPFGRHYLLNRGRFAFLILKFLNFLTGIPLFREVITTKMVFILRKG